MSKVPGVYGVDIVVNEPDITVHYSADKATVDDILGALELAGEVFRRAYALDAARSEYPALVAYESADSLGYDPIFDIAASTIVAVLPGADAQDLEALVVGALVALAAIWLVPRLVEQLGEKVGETITEQADKHVAHEQKTEDRIAALKKTLGEAQVRL